jgi:ankyrin repeat protein
MLIEHGADVTAQTKNGETPLHRASSLEVVRMLIEHGADVTARNKDDQTPLHWTLSPEVARTLIEHGADVAAQTKNGNTPLHPMSTRGQAEDAHVIERGSDVTVQNEGMDTQFNTFLIQFEAQRLAEVSRVLLKYGADVNARNKSGLTPFRLASECGLAEVTSVLLEHGADPGANDNTS